MSDEKLVNLMNEARLIAASDHILFPLLKELQIQRLNQACARFTVGETSFVADIAYIQGLKDVENRLKRIQTEGNKAFHELNK